MFLVLKSFGHRLIFLRITIVFCLFLSVYKAPLFFQVCFSLFLFVSSDSPVRDRNFLENRYAEDGGENDASHTELRGKFEQRSQSA